MKRQVLRVCCCAVVGLLSVGCSNNAVQEDRTISFGPGTSATFQHGSAGVFIDIDGETRCIFEPSDDVIAVGSPQWSPDRRYVLFTTAVALDSISQGGGSAEELEPDGRLLLKQGVRYTCWRYDSKKSDGSKPTKLFDATCGHAGYVGAKLAVRWSADGASVFFIDAAGSGGHNLKRFDLQTKTTTVAFPHVGRWLVFETVPESDQVTVCVEGPRRNGVWIGDPTMGDWWHVADVRGANRLSTRGSAWAQLNPFMPNTSDSPIERLRGLMPTWTSDGTRFAFISREEAEQGGAVRPKPETFHLRVGILADQRLSVVMESTKRMSDVRWHPSRSKLGFVQYQDTGRADVVSVSLDGTISRTLASDVHQFAGWDSPGDRLAVVIPGELSEHDRDNWAFLMYRTTPGPETLRVVGRTEPDVFSGTRVTFPSWSPDGSKLSFWATFTPRHQSLLSLIGRQASHGDPAVTIDLESGEVNWMPVSGLEKLFVGNYYLLKDQPGEALKWYDEAELPEPNPSNRLHLTLSHLYRAIALRRLGRSGEADVAETNFAAATNAAFGGDAAPEDSPRGLTPEQKLKRREAIAIQRQLLIVEAYASVDGLEECQQRLCEGRAGESALDVLAREIAMGQVLLLQGDKIGFIELVSESLLQNAAAQVADGSVSLSAVSFDDPLRMSLQFCFWPLLCDQFYEGIPGEQLSRFGKAIAELETSGEGSGMGAGVVVALEHIRRVAARAGGDAVAASADVGSDAVLDEEKIQDVAHMLRSFPDSLKQLDSDTK